MPIFRRQFPATILVTAIFFMTACGSVSASGGHDELVQLFEDWRAFESPPLVDGAPDYSSDRFEQRQGDYHELRERLTAFDIGSWPIPEQVDWHLIRAEMNGYDFNRRILKPWARDPAFYNSIFMHRSDVPAHEGPTHHAVVEVWTYEFPLSHDERQRLLDELDAIPPLLEQARSNLTGSARDLWVTGIRNVRRDADELDQLREMIGDSIDDELDAAIVEVRTATDELVTWLEEQAPSKTGPSGIGKDNYTWYQQNVHLVPLTWEDEVRLL